MKSSLYSNFETDITLESDGIEIDFGDGVFIKSRRAGGSNKTYQREATDWIAEATKNGQPTDLMSDEQTEELIKIFAKTCITGWHGVTDREGNEIPFSAENAFRVFKDLPEFFKVYKAQVSDWRNFRTKWEDETVKESAPQ